MSVIYDTYAAHSRLAVAGLTIFNIDKVPSVDGALKALPCIIPMLGDSAANPGFDQLSASQGQGDLTLQPTFLLAVSKVEAGRPGTISRAVFEAFEAYFDAWRTDPDFNDRLSFTARINATFGVFEWMDASWVGARLTHTWAWLVD